MLLPVRSVGILFCLLLTILLACAEKEPSRDEIPHIKNVLARFESAAREKNATAIDSLIIAEDGSVNLAKVLKTPPPSVNAPAPTQPAPAQASIIRPHVRRI